MIGQLVRSILPDRAAAAVQIATRVTGDGTVLEIAVQGEDGRPRTDLPLLLVHGNDPVPTLRRSDRYEASIGTRTEVTTVRIRVGPAQKPLAEKTIVLPPSSDPERTRTGIDRAALLRIVGAPEHMEPVLAEALRPPEAPTSNRRALWLPFLAFAAILLPLDAWARRRQKSASR